MELKTMVLGHFLVISLALNAGLLYRNYSNGFHKSQDLFSFNNECKNSSLLPKMDSHVAENPFLETNLQPSKPPLSEIIDLDQ